MGPVIAALEQHPAVETVNVLTSQHTDLVRPMIELFGVRVDHDLQIMRPGQIPAEVTARILERLGPIFGSECAEGSEKSTMVLVQGDTATTLAGALAAFYRRIPVGHIEAGLRTDDPVNPFPEEMHRRIVSQMASLHLASTGHNRDLLLAEGIAAPSIVVTGNPVIDALLYTLDKTEPSQLVAAAVTATAGTRRIVLTTHRRESFGEVMSGNLRVLRNFIEEHEDVSLVFPVHPNPAVLGPTREILGDCARVHLMEPLGYSDFLHLLKQAWLVVSDSGGVQEEVPTLGKALFVLRENTERPEVLEAGLGRLVGGDPELLRRCLDEVYDDDAWIRSIEQSANPFGDGASGPRIASEVVRYLDARQSGGSN